jgi:nitroreductase
MAKLSRDAVLEQINWRYATKRFDTMKKIGDADIETIETAMSLSPSSYGLQPWKFINVQNQALRGQLRAAAYNQPQVTEASHVYIFAAKKGLDENFIDHYIQQVADVRGMSTENLKGFRDTMVGDLVKGPRSKIIDSWSQRQCYIALGFLLETACLLEVDACPMEGFDPAGFDKILGLEGTGWGTVCMAALGFRSPEDQTRQYKKVRFSKNEVFSRR